MKKLFSILVIFIFCSTGCYSDSETFVDPLAEFRSLSTNLTQLVQDQYIEAGQGYTDAPTEEKAAYLTAIADLYLSQQYCIPTYNSIVSFEILDFAYNIYTNTTEDMTINVLDDQYVFEMEEVIIIESNLENTSVQFTYNPERATWLFIGKRGGVVNGNLSDAEPRDVWIRQEGAIIDGTTYYVSTVFHLAGENNGTTHTTNGIVTYGASDNPAFAMAGEHTSCQSDSDCISIVYTPIFSNGITSAYEEWEDFKYYKITTIDYEINLN